MRECKQSDVQALEVVLGSLQQFNVELTMIKGKLVHLENDLKRYIQEQSQPINIETVNEN
jgi:hypothetical protein